MINLKGMTWDHSRGFDPMVATSKKFQEIHNNKVSIEWDKRPLHQQRVFSETILHFLQNVHPQHKGACLKPYN